MNPSVELAFASHAVGLLKHAAEQAAEQVAAKPPNYNDTLRTIAKRQAVWTAKEVGSVTLPLAAGYGVGKGIQKYMQRKGQPVRPVASKIKGLAMIPAVALSTAAAYQTARKLKEHGLQKIREEEMQKYHDAVDSHQRGLKRTPVPEASS